MVQTRIARCGGGWPSMSVNGASILNGTIWRKSSLWSQAPIMTTVKDFLTVEEMTMQIWEGQLSRKP